MFHKDGSLWVYIGYYLSHCRTFEEATARSSAFASRASDGISIGVDALPLVGGVGKEVIALGRCGHTVDKGRLRWVRGPSFTRVAPKANLSTHAGTRVSLDMRRTRPTDDFGRGAARSASSVSTAHMKALMRSVAGLCCGEGPPSTSGDAVQTKVETGSDAGSAGWH